MAKFFGKLGFCSTVEETINGVGNGVWKNVVTERPYYGDVIKRSYRYSTPEKVNNDVDISNEISIVQDEYAISHLSNLVYVEWLGTRWKVSNIAIEYPRMTLSLGGVYNGDTP